MDPKSVARFREYLAQVDAQARDAREFDDSLAFLGYKESFKHWVALIIDDIQKHTPFDTGSGAFEAATRALDGLGFPSDAKFESLIRNLKEALERAIQWHSLLVIRDLEKLTTACDKIHSDPEATLSEFCRRFADAVDSAAKPGASITVQITPQHRHSP